MAQRVLAVIVAVALVLVAVVVRNTIDDDGSPGSDDGGDGDVVLVCAADLSAACEALEGVEIIEAPAVETAEAIEARSPVLDGVDGWITTSAWVEVVESRAAGRLGEASSVASSSTVVAADPDRAAAVSALCEGEALWDCLGTNAGTEWADLGPGDPSWGPLKTGLPSADSAVGLPVVAAASAGFFGGTEFARNDFDPTGFRGWLTQLTEPSRAGERSPIGTLVTSRGKYTAVGDVAAAVGARQVTVIETPRVDATVVLVPFTDGDPLPAMDRLRDALVAAGWTAATGAPVPLLKPGVMAALHTLWTEVTR